MQLVTVKSVIIGVGTAAAVIAITGAASGSGVGAVFNLGKINKVNATSSLTGSTKRSMLSVTNKGAGTALSLQVANGKAPFSVNSSTRVANLNASLLGGLAAGQFVQGGGQSRSFGFTSTFDNATKNLLRVPGFGTFIAICATGGGAFVDLMTGSHSMDKFAASIDSTPGAGVGHAMLIPNTNFAVVSASNTGVNAVWERMILRYTTGSGNSRTTHIATADVMVDVGPTTCDFDASAIIGPGVKGP